MTLLEILLVRFGLLMSYEQLGELFGYAGPSATGAMRQRLRRDAKLGSMLEQATLRLGRRIYFRTDIVASTLDMVTGIRTSDRGGPVLSGTSLTGSQRPANGGDAETVETERVEGGKHERAI